MEANATLDYGALQVELRAENATKLESELRQIIEFLEENDDRINSIFNDIDTPNVDNSENDSSISENDIVSQSVSDGPLGRVAQRVRVSEETLESFILTDDDYPTLFLDDEKILGDHKSERQRKASLILLYLWDECYGEERVKTSSLKNALSMSGISDSNLANMYQGQGDRFFDRTGRGASATIGLTTPGERRAQKAISDLVLALENNGDEFGQTTTEDFR